jgi:hypothetical protein
MANGARVIKRVLLERIDIIYLNYLSSFRGTL